MCPAIGTYDKDAELSVNTAIASPLLSRFDIILLMLDSQNAEWDRNVSDMITCDGAIALLLRSYVMVTP
jgi:DNA helicase MCM9